MVAGAYEASGLEAQRKAFRGDKEVPPDPMWSRGGAGAAAIHPGGVSGAGIDDAGALGGRALRGGAGAAVVRGGSSGGGCSGDGSGCRSSDGGKSSEGKGGSSSEGGSSGSGDRPPAGSRGYATRTASELSAYHSCCDGCCGAVLPGSQPAALGWWQAPRFRQNVTLP